MSEAATKATGEATDRERPRYLFVTGRLAEPMVRRTVAALAEDEGFEAEVAVVGITVAALIHVGWLRRRLPREAVAGFDRVYITGWVQGDLESLASDYGVPFFRGPKDVADLPALFGRGRQTPDLESYDIEILAEINHAPRLPLDELLAIAERHRRDGADVIDVGCIPGHTWPELGTAVRRLREAGHRVSVDSFDRAEVTAAVEAGAERVLSGNSQNLDWLIPLCRGRADVVAIPDDPHELATLHETAAKLTAGGVRPVLDAILEPIGFGFAASLVRYHEVRRRHPTAAMMMGVGNVTEMTGVDSAGVNMLLAAICQELAIGSVLTTEVINWARTAVREFDIARRMVRYAVERGRVPKHIGDDLVMLRDPRGPSRSRGEVEQMAGEVRDPNYRILVECGEIFVFNRDGCWHGRDAYELFDAFVAARRDELTADHAFYLGYELSKAVTALTLGKRYEQDEALRWGFLTVEEPSALERRRRTQRLASDDGEPQVDSREPESPRPVRYGRS